LDSLVYSWGQPLSDVGTPIPFAPGYSVNSQLPSPTQTSTTLLQPSMLQQAKSALNLSQAGISPLW
jgi:hypothetical protein